MATKGVLGAALRKDSALADDLKSGLGALAGSHSNLIDSSVKPTFSDSLDLDSAMKDEFPNANRWDYLLGHNDSKKIVGLEPHSARSSEVSTVIQKRKDALNQLRPHLKDGKHVADWLWVASGKVDFSNTDKIIRQLDENGIQFVGKKVLAKHLPK